MASLLGVFFLLPLLSLVSADTRPTPSPDSCTQEIRQDSGIQGRFSSKDPVETAQGCTSPAKILKFIANPGHTVYIDFGAGGFTFRDTPDGECKTDYLSIIGGEWAHPLRGNRELPEKVYWCSKNVNPPSIINSMYSTLTLVYRSGKGGRKPLIPAFSGTYQFLDEHSHTFAVQSQWPGQEDPLERGCGGHNLGAGKSAAIIAPRNPQGDDISCAWTIRVDHGSRVLLKNSGPDCVAVTDGFDYYSVVGEEVMDNPETRQLCSGATFTTKRNRAVVTFKGPKQGDFSLLWTKVTPAKDGGSEACPDPGEFFKCPESFCIAKSLQCNGESNCPDGADERDCGAAEGTELPHHPTFEIEVHYDPAANSDGSPDEEKKSLASSPVLTGLGEQFEKNNAVMKHYLTRPPGLWIMLGLAAGLIMTLLLMFVVAHRRKKVTRTHTIIYQKAPIKDEDEEAIRPLEEA